jgi:hypothetical protein
LVYASDSPDGLYTGICYSTKGVENASKEIAILERTMELDVVDLLKAILPNPGPQPDVTAGAVPRG